MTKDKHKETSSRSKWDKWVSRMEYMGFSIVLLFVTSWINGWSKMREDIDSKASTQYVDQRIKDHEEKEKEMLQPMRDDLALIKEFILYNKLPTNNNQNN